MGGAGQTGALERDLQTHRPHRQPSLGISSCIVDRMMCVCGPAQVLKILEHVLDHSRVQQAEVRARMAKRVSTREVPEIPVDELPIETIVVTHEQSSAFRVFPYPTREVLHHAQRIVEAECIAPCEPPDARASGTICRKRA
jgi:hypothetical protein